MDLEVMRKSHEKQIYHHIKEGGNVAIWKCPHCKEDNICRAPLPKDVKGKKNYWDSSKACVHCGKPAFVIVHVNRVTETVPKA